MNSKRETRDLIQTRKSKWYRDTTLCVLELLERHFHPTA